MGNLFLNMGLRYLPQRSDVLASASDVLIRRFAPCRVVVFLTTTFHRGLIIAASVFYFEGFVRQKTELLPLRQGRGQPTHLWCAAAFFFLGLGGGWWESWARGWCFIGFER